MTAEHSVLLVLGMHRSGTSLLSALTPRLGYRHSENLMEAGYSNPLGYFEDKSIVAINDKLLKLYGLSWWDAVFLLGRSDSLVEQENLITEASRVVSALIKRAPRLVLKDPRFCVTLPFWLQVFERLSVPVDALFTYRDPEEIAASLIRRDGLAVEHIRWLILSHWCQALHFGEEIVRAIVNCATLIESPDELVAKVASRLPDLAIAGEPIAERVSGKQLVDKSIMTRSVTVPEFFDGESGELLLALKKLLDQRIKPPSRSDLEPLLKKWRLLSAPFTEVHTFRGPIGWQDSPPLGIEPNAAISRGQKALGPVLEAYRQELFDLKKDNSALHQRLVSLEDLHQISEVEIKRLQYLVDDYSTALAGSENAVSALRASLSWRITAPIRLLIALPARALLHWKWAMSKPTLTQKLWGLVPLTVRKKHSLYLALKALLGKQSVLRPNSAGQPALKLEKFDDLDDVFLIEREQREYMPKLELDSADTAACSVTAIALYLPQFHCIPENDQWWGKGFTEWTNVKKAKSLFNGHRQPLRPHDDLGYYDLSDPAVLRQQAALAKLYGLGGFCFYFYWFGGKTLLERPLQLLLDNPDIDLPFMLCWANEHWTRTWDGLDSQTLIGQDHSPEDDIAFIEHVSTYFRDSRYIRVGDKPVLMLYRTDLLPDARATSERWRAWALEHLGVDLFLITTTSFGAVDAAQVGFDRVMEFTPNNTAPVRVNDTAPDLIEGFQGHLYNWRSVAQHSEHYQLGDNIYRTVCPSWDNTARRPNSGAVFVGSNPADFTKWLRNARRYTELEFTAPEERFLFINAWNEWAEGAMLEPTEQHGYQALKALRDGLFEAKDN